MFRVVFSACAVAAPLGLALLASRAKRKKLKFAAKKLEFESKQQSVVQAASSELKSASSAPLTVVDIEDIGFTRKEMYSVNIKANLDFYEKHFFIGFGDTVSQWPSKIDTEGLGKLFATVRKSLPVDSSHDKITASSAPLGTVMVFPDAVSYQLPLTSSDGSPISSFLSEDFSCAAILAILKQHLSPASSDNHVALPPASRITDALIFVCSHNNRDKRCGYCGPILHTRFLEELERSRSRLNFRAQVLKCSHIGGHAYAGNIIAFTPAHEEEGTSSAVSAAPSRSVKGDWYGYVVPDDVPRLLDAFAKGDVVIEKWRGAIGVPCETAKKMVASCAGCDCDQSGQDIR